MRWLTLLTSLPPKPTRHRVGVWRKLQRMGAVRLRGAGWIEQQWEASRLEAAAGRGGALLVLDEIQKIPAWSETVKRLWDEDTRARRALKVVLLGSASLLIASGHTESLAGRFETLHLPHWSLAEMRNAFGVSLLGPGALVHQDAWAAARRRQHHHAGALPGSAGRRGHGARAAQVCG
jgi:hypothetical protein